MPAFAPRILFVSLSDDVGSERIVSEMGRRGASCAVMSRAGAYAALSRHAVRHHPLPSRGGLWAAALGVRPRLDAAVRDWRPDAVVPLDDMAAGLLRDLEGSRRLSDAARALIRRSLGDPSHYRTASSRADLVEVAAALGVRTPAQRRVGDRAEAQAAAASLGFPLLVKREGTCGGGGVALARDAGALDLAFRRGLRRARAKGALRRLFGLGGVEGAPLSLQAFVEGQLALRTVACDAGRVLAGVSLAAECLDPPLTGSSTVVRPVANAEMAGAARRIVEALGLSGFASFDFLVDAQGRATLIEMNARPVGSGHLGARFGHDVYGAWLRRFPGFADRSREPVEAARSVALFPKEMRRDPSSGALSPDSDALHDVPWDEPRVLAAYRDLLARRHPGAAALIARRLGFEAAARAPDARLAPGLAAP